MRVYERLIILDVGCIRHHATSDNGEGCNAFIRLIKVGGNFHDASSFSAINSSSLLSCVISF